MLDPGVQGVQAVLCRRPQHTTQAMCRTAFARNGLSRLTSPEGNGALGHLVRRPEEGDRWDGLVKYSHHASLQPGPSRPGRWLPGSMVARAICSALCPTPPAHPAGRPVTRACDILATAQGSTLQ